MKFVCVALLLVLLHVLTSQVADAQTTSTGAPATVTSTAAAAAANVTVKENNGCGRMDAFSPLLPLLLAAHVLHGWFY